MFHTPHPTPLKSLTLGMYERMRIKNKKKQPKKWERLKKSKDKRK